MKVAKILLLMFFTLSLFSCSKKEADLNLIPILSGKKWGYIDREGKIQINPQFEKAYNFIDGVALVLGTDDKYGYIDEKGKYKINPQYKEALPFSEGLACVVSENGHPQYIDETGKMKFTVTGAEYAGTFHEGLAMVEIKEKWGYINTSGEVKINPQFEDVRDFSEGLAAVKKSEKNESGKWGFVDDEGTLVINPQFSNVGDFNEGLCLVSDGKKYGYINKEGKYAINPQFDEAEKFHNGLAVVKQGESYGYIDKEGKFVINPQFKYAQEFGENGLASVLNTDDKYGYIDKEAKYVINPQFEGASMFFGDIAFVNSSDKIGIINREGKYTVNPQFEGIFVEDLLNWRIYLAESDYFDAAGLAEKILEGTDKDHFMGLSAKSTFGELQNKYESFKNGDRVYRTSASTGSKEIDKYATLNNLEVNFAGSIYEDVPQYTTASDYWTGSYQYVSGYSKKYDVTQTVDGASASVSLTGKGYKKGKQVAEAVANLVNSRMGTKEDDQIKEALTKSYEGKENEGEIFLSNDGVAVIIKYDEHSLQMNAGLTAESVKNFKNYIASRTNEPVEDDYGADTTKMVP